MANTRVSRLVLVTLEVPAAVVPTPDEPPIFNVPENPDHVAEALALLIEQYKRKDHIRSLLDSYVEQIQILEGVAYDVWEKFLLDFAEGEQLDVLGRIVQEERGEKSDEQYRSFIKARIAINRSNGRIEEILNILRLVSTAGVVFRIEQLEIAAMVVYQTADPLSFDGDEQVIIDILKQAKGGGISIQFVYSLQPIGNRFQLSSQSGTLETSSSQGCANAAQTTGGHLSGVVN